MKSLLLLLILVLFWGQLTAQRNLNLVVEGVEDLSLFGVYNTSKIAKLYQEHFSRSNQFTYSYMKTNFGIGVDFSKNNYGLGIRLGYQCLISKQQVDTKIWQVKKAVLNSHLISFGIINRFRETKIIRPFIRIDFSSEVATNYKNKYLDALNYIPERYFLPFETSKYKKLNIYHSTPFVGDLLFGSDFKVFKGFSINVSLGYSIRVIKVQYAIIGFPLGPQPSVPIYEEKISQPYSLALNYLTFQLGLNYAFSFHKKEKKASE